MIRRIMLLFYELHYKFPRFKLWRICRALKIKPYKWQRAFALGETESLQYPHGRATGKTTAVMLRLLMAHPFCSPEHAAKIMGNDPDFYRADRRMIFYYNHEYKHLALRCAMAHIPVKLDIDMLQVRDAYRNFTRAPL